MLFIWIPLWNLNIIGKYECCVGVVSRSVNFILLIMSRSFRVLHTTPHCDDHGIIVVGISTSSALVSPIFESVDRSFVVNIWWAYLLRTELVSRLVNHPSIIFKVWHTSLSPSSFPFMAEDFNIVTPMRVGPAWPLGGVTFDIFLEMFLLDHMLYLIFLLVAIFYVMSLNLLELTPHVRLRAHYTHLWS